MAEFGSGSGSGGGLLCVRIAHGGRTTCDVVPGPRWTVRDLKAALEERIGVPRPEQRICTPGAACLRDDALLHDLPSTAGVLELALMHCPLERSEWQARINASWTELRHAPAWARADRQAALSAVRQQGTALRLLSDELRADREIVLAAVRQNGFALEFAAPALLADREVAMLAVSSHGDMLRLLPDELRDSREVVCAALRQNGRALAHASAALRADPEVALVAVVRSGGALADAEEAVRADRAVVLAAVRQDGDALRFAAPALRADRAVVEAAVSQSADALQYAAPELRADAELHRGANDRGGRPCLLTSLVGTGAESSGGKVRALAALFTSPQSPQQSQSQQLSRPTQHSLQRQPWMQRQQQAQEEEQHQHEQHEQPPRRPQQQLQQPHAVQEPSQQQVRSPLRQSHLQRRAQAQAQAQALAQPPKLAPAPAPAPAPVLSPMATQNLKSWREPKNSQQASVDPSLAAAGYLGVSRHASAPPLRGPACAVVVADLAAGAADGSEQLQHGASAATRLRSGSVDVRPPLPPAPQAPPVRTATERCPSRGASVSARLPWQSSLLGTPTKSPASARTPSQSPSPWHPREAAIGRLETARALSALTLSELREECERRSFGAGAGVGGVRAGGAGDAGCFWRPPPSGFAPHSAGSAPSFVVVGADSAAPGDAGAVVGASDARRAEGPEEARERAQLTERLLFDAVAATSGYGVCSIGAGLGRTGGVAERATAALAAAEQLERIGALDTEGLRSECLRLGLPRSVVAGRDSAELAGNLRDAQVWSAMSLQELLFECGERRVAPDAALVGGTAEQSAALVDRLLLDAWAPALEAAGVPARRFLGVLPPAGPAAAGAPPALPFAIAAALATRYDCLEDMDADKLVGESRRLGLVSSADRASMRRNLRKAALWAALPLAELRRECRTMNVAQPRTARAGVELTDRLGKDDLVNRLIAELCADWYEARGVPARRLGSAGSAALLLEQREWLRSMAGAELQLEFTNAGFPLEFGLDAAGILQRLQSAQLWRLLPYAELRKECQERGVPVDGVHGSDAECRQILEDRLLVASCQRTYQAIGVPAQRLGSVRSAAHVAERFKVLSKLGAMDLRCELERLGGCSLSCDRDEIESQVRQALIWTEMPFSEVIKDCTALGLASVRRETRRDLVLRLCLASWGPDAGPGRAARVSRPPLPRQIAAHFETLQLPATATVVEVRGAYRKLALRLHPDKIHGDSRDCSAAEFRKVVDAYNALSEFLKGSTPA